MKNALSKLKFKDNVIIYMILLGMAVVYALDMFCNKPWYDELYTYYSFISRGPVYSAIHWPVPNNHVGYSVLSGFLNIFGNPYISLRGVSYIASLANILLIYKLAIRFMDKRLAVCTVFLFVCSYLTYSLAFQGRGYALAITCYLVAIIAVLNICMGNKDYSNYILFIVSLTLGLYILPSSLYWVVPICIIGGLYLLTKRRIYALKGLVLAGVCAAAVTFFLYLLIWLAIGANLLSKDEGSLYYGIHQALIILRNPWMSFRTGIEYMLATPYIQSIDRADAIHGMPGYFKDLFDMCYSYCGIAFIVIDIVLIIFTCIYAFKNRHEKREVYFVSMYVSLSLFVTPLVLCIQSVHPYKRVLGFYLIPLYIGMMFGINILIKKLGGAIASRLINIVLGITIVCGILCILSPTYRAPLAGRENDIAEVLEQIDPTNIDTIYYMDDFQKYVLKFYYDVEPVEAGLEDANYVMVCEDVRDEKYEAAVWPVWVCHEDARLDYIEDNFVPVAATEYYTIYSKSGQ